MRKTPLKRTSSPKRKTPMKKVNRARMDKRTKQYRAYMQSSEWRLRRLAAMIAAKWTCQRCGYVKRSGTAAIADLIESRELHIHHTTYARFGRELPEDLEVLCESCHEKEHAGRALKPRFMRAG